MTIKQPATKMKLMLVVGARPNFMKIASIADAINKYNSTQNSKFKIQYLSVHTGQHYDSTMSEAFFKDLDLPKPDIYLEVGSGSHAVQTAEIMKRFEPVLLEHQPDGVVLVGDVNSTVACALVASKIDYSTPNSELKTQNSRRRPWIAHVEAGLRSFDRSMPEEVNRLLTDGISDFLFTTEESANENLKREGIPEGKIYFVGNTMIDTLLKHREKAQHSNILETLGLINLELKTENSNLIPYGVLTLHRPSNVDDRETFHNILEALLEISKHLPVIFPAHPRTVNRIKEFRFETYFNFVTQNSTLKIKNYHLNCLEPLGYLDFLCLMSNAKLVLTDSGGMQEETTVLGIPCITLRENTERPVTITFGTNILAGVQKEQIISAALSALTKRNSISPNSMFNTQHSTLSTQHSFSPPLWDGQAGQRIVRILVDSLLDS